MNGDAVKSENSSELPIFFLKESSLFYPSSSRIVSTKKNDETAELFFTSSYDEDKKGVVRRFSDADYFGSATCESLQYREISLKNEVEQTTALLFLALRCFENADEESFWRITDEIVSSKANVIIGQACQKIVFEHFDSVHALCCIAKFLTNFDLPDAEPWGPIVLASLLNHKDAQVVESAVILLDNWEDAKLLPLLKNLSFSSDWLCGYIDEVVVRLGG